MKKNDCIVYIANTKGADSNKLYESFGKQFEPRRTDRIQRSSNEKVKRNLILTGTLLVKALSECGASTGDIEYGSFEKPYLKGKKNLFFNISHSGDYIVVAVSGQEIGVDIQKPSAYNEKLVNKICSLEERETMESEIIKHFNRVWALKESFSKLKSDGILMDFTRITFDEELNSVVVSLDGKKVAIAVETEMPDGYAMFVSAYSKFDISNVINVCF